MSLDTLPVENIVPESLRTLDSATEFMASLTQYDEYFQKLNTTANNDQQVLRYIGVIDPIGDKSEVKLVRYVIIKNFVSLCHLFNYNEFL